MVIEIEQNIDRWCWWWRQWWEEEEYVDMGYSIGSILFSILMYSSSHFNLQQQAKEKKSYSLLYTVASHVHNSEN